MYLFRILDQSALLGGTYRNSAIPLKAKSVSRMLISPRRHTWLSVLLNQSVTGTFVPVARGFKGILITPAETEVAAANRPMRLVN